MLKYKVYIHEKKGKTLDFASNHLYYGDCLDVMDSFLDKSVDLIYLDPPLNSNAHVFVLPMQNTEKSDTVHEALTGVWTWSPEAEQRGLNASRIHTIRWNEQSVRLQ